MSLIYDYLKIYGKSNSVKDSDVEIPPTLTRKESSRFTTRSLLFILCSSLIGILCLFLVFKILSSREDIRIAANLESLPKIAAPRSQTETAPPVEETGAESKPALPQNVESTRLPAAEPVFPVSPDFAESKNNMQVFPETGKQEKSDAPAGLQTASVAPETAGVALEPPEVIKKKIPQPPELISSSRKKVSLEEQPVYREAKKPAADKVSTFPHGREVPVERPSSSASPASMEKSRKFYQAGLQAHQSGDHRIADIYYNKALEEFPDNIEAMINLSALYVQQERYAEAEAVLADILAIDPNNSKALINMGMISLQQNNETRAEVQFKAALAANPAEENALINLAYLAEKKRDFATTEMYYKNLLQISPDNLPVLLAYGHLLEEDKRYQEAVSLYKDCLELGAVVKDQQLHSKISQRLRILAAALRN